MRKYLDCFYRFSQSATSMMYTLSTYVFFVFINICFNINYYQHLFSRFSPIGICSLIAGKLAGMEDIKDNLESLGLYMLTVIVGLLIHALFTLPIIYFVIVRKNPLHFFFGMGSALLTAFGTSSRFDV